MLAGPAPQGSGDELVVAIGAQHQGFPLGQDSQVKHFHHVGGSHWPLDAERWVLAGERIDSVTCLDDTPLPVGVELHINGPHLPGSTSRDHGVGDAARCGALRARTRRPFRARASAGTYRAQ